MTDTRLDELIAHWHLGYGGDLSLVEYMWANSGWTREQTEHWIETGEKP